MGNLLFLSGVGPRERGTDKIPGVKVVAISDKNPKNKIFGRKIKFFNNYNKLFKEELDVLFISLPNKLFAGQLITVTNNAIDKNNNPRKCKVLCFFTSIKLVILYLLNRPIDMLIKTRVRNIYKYAFIKNLLQVNFPPLKEFLRIPSVRSPDNISSI